MSLLETAILRAKVLTPKDIGRAEKLANVMSIVKIGITFWAQIIVKGLAIRITEILFPDSLFGAIFTLVLMVSVVLDILWFYKTKGECV